MIALPMVAMCPATFCPLFASAGSPWTGERRAQCEGDGCGWWDERWYRGCIAGPDAAAEIWRTFNGKAPVRQKPECKHENECQWQRQLGQAVCPPRLAVMHGADPRIASF